MNEVYKTIFIIIVFSPFLISVGVLTWLIKKGIRKAQKYAISWLILGIILAIIWLSELFSKKSDYATLFLLGSWASNALSIYFAKRKNKT